jgi:hypothetical protein
MAHGGKLVRAVPPYRRMALMLFPRRNDAVVYFEQPVDVTDTLPWIERWNDSGKPHLTLFLLLVHVVARVLCEHERLNRFVAGRRLYQRDGVWLSFTAKKSMAAGAPLVVVKRCFPAGESLAALTADMAARIAEARSDTLSYADKEMGLLLRLPRPLLALLVRLVGLLAFFGLLPASFVRNDPFFASAFLTNLGSVGGRAGFHHLYEYGNIPMFCTLGRVTDEVVAHEGRPAVRKVARLGLSYDERIEDGFNAVRAIDAVRALLEAPDRLDG